jgi:3,4-dihydroxy-2-butanone 4-phosphate synthase
MVSNTEDPIRTAYTVSIDANHPTVTTGISAHDRSLACQMLADPKTTAHDLRRPGHILPLRARPGGVRVRRGHTEATVDLCRLAGKFPAGVIAELVEEGESVFQEEADIEGDFEDQKRGQEQEVESGRNGEHTANNGVNRQQHQQSHTNGATKKKAGKARKLKAEIGGQNGMMRRNGCLKFGEKYGLKVCTIEDMVKYLEEKNIVFPIEEESESEVGRERVEVSGHLNGKHA